MTQIKMTTDEYEFLTGAWRGPKGAAFNAVYEFCREFGWLSPTGETTPKGLDAIKAYQTDQSWKKVEAH